LRRGKVSDSDGKEGACDRFQTPAIRAIKDTLEALDRDQIKVSERLATHAGRAALVLSASELEALTTVGK
jgi:histone H3/H4